MRREAIGYHLHLGFESLNMYPAVKKQIIWGVYPRGMKAEVKQSATNT